MSELKNKKRIFSQPEEQIEEPKAVGKKLKFEATTEVVNIELSESENSSLSLDMDLIAA